MQQAIPYKSWQPFTPLRSRSSSTSTSTTSKEEVVVRGSGDVVGGVSNMVSENAVIVFAKRGCCMSHVVKSLLQGLGVNPCVCEVDEGDDDHEEACVLNELEMVNKSNNNGSDSEQNKVQFPAVFIGGKFFGGLDKIMAAHISGDLIPVLKDAKALWL